MTRDLVLNSIGFNYTFDEKGKSVRQSISRGINKPDTMTVQNQDYVDSATKLPGRRYLIRFDRVNINATTGERYVTSAYVVYQIPLAADGSDSSAVVATLKACIDETTEGLVAHVLNSEL
jgi:hypothetical protein